VKPPPSGSEGRLAPPTAPLLAALVATANRPAVLRQRALASIATQTRRPDVLVVVDDSDRGPRAAARRAVAAIDLDSRVVFLDNERGKGAAGAWNTGLEWLLGEYGERPETFVAILDDDDEWRGDHLERCLASAVASRLDMVVAGIERIDAATGEAHPLWIPRVLAVEQLLVRSPHIQGSNLFVRLAALARAGWFDEALKATTDRDVCLRLATLPGLRYGTIDEHTVRHYSDFLDASRLSTMDSPARRAGLAVFHRKYGPWMAPAVEQAFLKRAFDNYRFKPDAARRGAAAPREATEAGGAAIPSDDGGIETLLALPAAASDVGALAKLVASCRDHRDALGVTRFRLLIGCDEESSPALAEWIARTNSEAPQILVAQLATRRLAVRDGSPLAARLAMLPAVIAAAAEFAPGAVFLLEPGHRFDACVATRRGDLAARRAFRLPRRLAALRAAGIGIALPLLTGDSPLPWWRQARVALVDLLHALFGLAWREPDVAAAPVRHSAALESEDDADVLDGFGLEATHALEMPLAALPVDPTPREALAELAREAPRILAGCSFLRTRTARRPLGAPLGAPPRDGARFRGPWLVLEVEALRSLASSLAGASDEAQRATFAALAASGGLPPGAGPRGIALAAAPLRLERESDESPDAMPLDVEALAAAIVDHANDAALLALALERREGARGRGAPEVDAAASFASHFGRQTKRAEAATRAALLRIDGAAGAIEGLLGAEPRGDGSATIPAVPTPWWRNDAAAAPNVSALLAIVGRIRSRLPRGDAATFEELSAALARRKASACDQAFAAWKLGLPTST
jgi:hypothetical protein